ncbi:MAG TPA: thiolase family protein [Gemmatimonadales bacterium]|nr:thiolase family protein [Gemmatimonadales bacterium]
MTHADVFLTAACRTPVARAGGALAAVRPDDLAALVLGEAARRAGLAPGSLDDVILGCAGQAGEDSRNVARIAALLAGFPVEVPGQTVNRLCGSGLQAVASAAQAIRAGEGERFLAGGVESMSRAPWVMRKPDRAWPRGAPEVADSALGWRFTNPRLPAEWTITMGHTAEVVARRYGITREMQDAYAAESQRRAAAAAETGGFAMELVPVALPGGGTVERDEAPRPDTTTAALAALRPAFERDGTVTAGNASGLNDGAAALAVVSGAAAREAGAVPLARIVATAVAGVSPEVMGIGPVPAVRKVLARAGLGIADVDLWELNEAFAAQVLACIRDLGLDAARVNVHGGAIALGHPLGSSGARLLTTLVHALRRRGGRFGVATMCIGVGQGIAMVVEAERGP